MSERSLLLLGMLMEQSLHGYQVNELIEKHFYQITEMKKATAYHLLEKLCAGQFVSSHSEKDGNRPQRKVFSITEQGRQRFLHLLRENLSQSDTLTFPGNIGLLLINHLPPEEVVECLQRRLDQLERNLAADENTPRNSLGSGFGQGLDLAIEHKIVMMRAERAWLIEVIDRYKSHTSPT